MYTTTKGKNGVRYMKDNRFVSKKDVPADILIKLDVGMTDVITTEEPEIKKCIFCGMATKGYRLLNQQQVYLCTEDYYDKNIGQIAQQVRRTS